jgi:hypothetical protein
MRGFASKQETNQVAWFMQKTNTECGCKTQNWNHDYQLVDVWKNSTTYDLNDEHKLLIVNLCAGTALDLSWLRRELKTTLLNESTVSLLLYLETRSRSWLQFLKMTRLFITRRTVVLSLEIS